MDITSNVKESQFSFDDESDFSSCPPNHLRISLAYGQLDSIPNQILTYFSDQVQFLDLSYNNFKNLSFLQHFPELQTLILDRNHSLDCSTLPEMRNLEVIWLNNCNLIDIASWLHMLQAQCPRLKQLSMMCNPVGLTVLNGVTDDEEKEYRKQVVEILPQLNYFDGMAITECQRRSFKQGKHNITLLEHVFRWKLRKFLKFPLKLHKNWISLENLNMSVLGKSGYHALQQAIMSRLITATIERLTRYRI